MLIKLLAVYLLLVVPARNVWHSLRPASGKPVPSRLRRYWSMSWEVVLLLGVLAVGCWQAGYSARDLGFDLPLSAAGVWGLVFAGLLFVGLNIASSIMERRFSPEKRQEADRKLLDSPFPWPRTRAEIVAFVASITVMTAGWDILYRGFLLLLLVPHTGLPVAIIICAVAYGLAHGYRSPKQLIGAILSAFIFTIAYALTNSLWWLIVIHAGIPLGTVPAVLRAYRRQSQ